MSSELAARSLSAFPLSVGTSLAFESIFEGGGSPIDPDRVIPQRINLREYDAFWINVETLYRNVIHSLQKGDIDNVKHYDVAVTIMEEMAMIDELLRNEGQGATKAVYYLASYETALKRLERTQAKLKSDNTELQKRYAKMREDTMKMILNSMNKNATTGAAQDNVKIIKDSLTPAKAGVGVKSNHVLILTHIAYDLVSEPHFSTMHLLESHTGVLKKKNQFHTKYTNGKSLPMMPFLDGLMPVFGDSEFFSPMPIKARNSVIELATTYRWTPLTTRTKVLHDFQYMKDQFLAAHVKQFF